MSLVSIENLRKQFLRRRSGFFNLYTLTVFICFIFIGYIFTINFGIDRATFIWSILLPLLFSAIEALIGRKYKKTSIFMAWLGVVLGITVGVTYGMVAA